MKKVIKKNQRWIGPYNFDYLCSETITYYIDGKELENVMPQIKAETDKLYEVIPNEALEELKKCEWIKNPKQIIENYASNPQGELVSIQIDWKDKTHCIELSSYDIESKRPHYTYQPYFDFKEEKKQNKSEKVRLTSKQLIKSVQKKEKEIADLRIKLAKAMERYKETVIPFLQSGEVKFGLFEEDVSDWKFDQFLYYILNKENISPNDINITIVFYDSKLKEHLELIKNQEKAMLYYKGKREFFH